MARLAWGVVSLLATLALFALTSIQYVSTKVALFALTSIQYVSTVRPFMQSSQPVLHNLHDWHEIDNLHDWHESGLNIYEWNTTLLNSDQPVRVVSTHARNQEDIQECKSRNNTKMTIVFSTYGSFGINANRAPQQLLEKYLSGALDETVDRIVIAWNPKHDGTETLIRQLKVWNASIPVEIVLHRENYLQNRFSFGKYLCTDAVFHVDNDVDFDDPSFNYLKLGFKTFQKNPDVIVGYYCAGFTEQLRYMTFGLTTCSNCKMILMGLAFVHAKYHTLFFAEKFKPIRDKIELVISGEDIAMNFVVADHLKLAHNKVGSSIKMCPKCLPKKSEAVAERLTITYGKKGARLSSRGRYKDSNGKKHNRREFVLQPAAGVSAALPAPKFKRSELCEKAFGV
uniref:Glycosyl transferase 64 domain-containing protein n=1 Tax=Mucochytrium quahogii TaxID=96639 RepID=A0A7S2RUS6_9STRA|mmetsp:Transcript_20408/g.44313  ORF Transcript_20408/g.44313 Transcript_20408/m.44313 type:complete len:398 (+) Transcript_20408:197-1390(+)